VITDVFEVRGDADLGTAHCCNAADLDTLLDLREKGILPSKDRFVKLEIDNFSPTDHAVLTDCVEFFSGTLLLSSTASAVLEATLQPEGYFLDCKVGASLQYRLFVCTHELTVLDDEKSQIEYFPTGNILRVKKFAFRKEGLSDADVFKISRLHGSLFVTNRFVSSVEANGLRGFEFIHVWNDERGGDLFDPDQHAYEAYPGALDEIGPIKRRQMRDVISRGPPGQP